MTHHTTLFRMVPAVRRAAIAAALALPLAGQASAQTAPPAAPPAAAPAADEKAMTILQGMSDYLVREKTLSFRAHTFFDAVQPNRIKVKTARTVDVLKAQDKLYADTLDDAGGATSLWYDNAKLTVWRRTANEVMTLDFTGGTDKLLDELTDKYEFQLPLADLLYSDVKKALGETIMSSEYIGVRMVDGVPCHQISFESEGADWQLWIEADASPVPRRFVIDYVTEESQPQFMAQLDAWSLGGEFEDFRFTAVMPAGVKTVEFSKLAATGAAAK
jgi:hypothetical protein